jgi:hypothetical protein
MQTPLVPQMSGEQHCESDVHAPHWPPAKHAWFPQSVHVVQPVGAMPPSGNVPGPGGGGGGPPLLLLLVLPPSGAPLLPGCGQVRPALRMAVSWCSLMLSWLLSDPTTIVPK